MEDSWFIIKNLQDFVDGTRILVFINFGNQNEETELQYTSMDQLNESDREELNQVLSHDETLTIIKSHITKQKNKKKKRTRYILSESDYSRIVEDLNQRLVSNLMIRLVNKGLVETAFDNEANDFVFWVNNNDDKKENPETD